MTHTQPLPAARSSESDYSSRFLKLNRWSLIGMLWLFVVAFSSIVFKRAGGVGAETFMGVAVAVAACLVGAMVLETRPELRLEASAHGGRWLQWGLSAHLLTLAVCVVAFLFAPAQWKAASAIALGAVFFSVLIAFLPFLAKKWVWTGLALAAVFALVSAFGSVETAAVLLAYSVACAVTVPFTKWFSRAMIETERARRLESQLTAAQERLRMSQDLHDTMGQHLAALTIKSQLALALAEREDPRVPQELRELHELTQRAASDMRSVVNNYRTPDLATELESAKQVLAGAGAEVTVTGTSEDVHPQLRETAAWFVRETTTNILRHSQATAVSFEFQPRTVTVTNDNPRPGEGGGTGLEGLRRRAAEHGASMSVERSAARFRVRLKVDA
ncbi:sensor histidine kinase [Corynebacterium sp. p3-SID1056]|uniref:sensor histidine kinase n=1 Tax=Corynebacterium sp. p3-SID1056 TaxID=2916092 RepID=UPI0021A44818|nr:histidine kinase [Corynebacterium sp. p3-SID1056]MCT2339237.1 histidine kinase [Corynebacterium sp. p3-SID1056]